ncbi:exodeoxyribonuclease VII large subunit [Patescibacteria group bacterium]|nr:exodeoxyribonuclease VII large subunit [Patescibacteria group bacterium]
MISTDIIPVSKYLDRLNTTLKGEKAKIIGEICNVQMYEERTYLYFSIKDSKDGSTIKCFMWKRDFKISGVALRDGLEVIVTAYPSIYKPNGGLSLQVELIELVGEGALQIAYELLKKKLEAEGLFNDERKRAIPMYPHKIGVITSRSGAVINDFLTNIGKFGYKISFVDSRVEGQDAIKDLLLAIETLKKEDIDVLVIMRGGGSLESFLAFNNEILVRALAGFPVPVLSGIGHDKDAPLASMVTDRNVSTPTAVANLLNSTWNDALSGVRLAEEKIMSQYQVALRDSQYMIENSEVTIQKRFSAFLDMFRKAEETLYRAVEQIERGILQISETISQREKDLSRDFLHMISNTKEYLKHSAKTLELASPERLLTCGYSIVKSGGKVVRYVQDVSRGNEMEVIVSDGIIKSKVI